MRGDAALVTRDDEVESPVADHRPGYSTPGSRHPTHRLRTRPDRRGRRGPTASCCPATAGARSDRMPVARPLRRAPRRRARERRASSIRSRIRPSAHCSIWRTRSALSPRTTDSSRSVRARLADAVARAHHQALAVVEAGHQRRDLLDLDVPHGVVVGVLGAGVGDEVLVGRATVVAHRLAEAARRALRADEAVDVVRRQAGARGELGDRRLAPVRRDQRRGGRRGRTRAGAARGRRARRGRTARRPASASPGAPTRRRRPRTACRATRRSARVPGAGRPPRPASARSGRPRGRGGSCAPRRRRAACTPAPVGRVPRARPAALRGRDPLDTPSRCSPPWPDSRHRDGAILGRFDEPAPPAVHDAQATRPETGSRRVSRRQRVETCTTPRFPVRLCRM